MSIFGKLSSVSKIILNRVRWFLNLKFEKGSTDNLIPLIQQSWFGLIFSHDFAKAFWGTKIDTKS